jgi:cytochrome oxidase Cu insertion factor (SCO1/SenC/PrrC family)
VQIGGVVEPRKKSPWPRRLLIAAITIVVLLCAATIAVRQILKAHIATRGPGAIANSVAADFTLADANGASVSLASLTARGPAVIVFYRGFW